MEAERFRIGNDFDGGENGSRDEVLVIRGRFGP